MIGRAKIHIINSITDIYHIFIFLGESYNILISD
jgi:hypothetical protein